MALEHITVLDLTHMLSGPYGTMLLADLGARTIKVEPPGSGEGTRRLLENDPHYSRDGMGAYYLTLNRNKQSVCVDLKTPAGKAVFLDLVRKADVVFDNFSVGVTERLGIDYATLSKVNPRIVTCSVTGFGQTGPETQRPAFDQVVQAMGGGMSITGTPQTGPIRAGIPIGDLGGGVFGALGVMDALVSRISTGLGKHVDVSMLDVQISLLNYMATMYLMSGNVPGRLGNGHFVHVPYNTYRTQTSHIIIACIGDAFFEQLLNVLSSVELREPRYLKQPARLAEKVFIDGVIERELMTGTAEHWLEKLRAARIPCAPVNSFEQAMNDPQILARNMVVDVTLQSGEVVRMPGNPIKFAGEGEQAFTAPPLIGEHTEAVLRDFLHYPPERLSALREKGVIQ